MFRRKGRPVMLDPNMGRHLVTGMRRWFFAELHKPQTGLLEVREEHANLISSLCDDGLHKPLLDIDDCEIKLVPSSTPGHSHIFIEKGLPWNKYKKLLTVLAECGITDADWTKHSLDQGMSILRKPGTKKSGFPSCVSCKSEDSHPGYDVCLKCMGKTLEDFDVKHYGQKLDANGRPSTV